MTKELTRGFEWLLKEPGPRMLTEALALYGIEETQGPGNTPQIMQWARELGPGVASVYTADSVPWCGLFVATCAKRAGKPLPASPLWARSWASWGEHAPEPMLGDVLVFLRTGGGHVGLYVGEGRLVYYVLGGNQGDAVSIAPVVKTRMIAARRCYRDDIPENVRKVAIDLSQAASTNEA